ncbi:MAG: A/G-specific adenine glycosylase [Spirochaeta sp.]|nr:A/G-specific adenine glycosylase [Spirochaeta sp.]
MRPSEHTSQPIPVLSSSEVTEFQRLILEYYRRCGRVFPWRESTDPYSIYVSEIMLQQTQTERVVPKYYAFLSALPDWRALAKAELRQVLTLWSGLGYNRRARNLKRAAEIVVCDCDGRLPREEGALRALPGIGPGTAGSLQAFVYNLPVVFIETNIRRVFLHVYFPGRNEVSDKEILPLVAATLYTDSPRDWYNALMDYGVFLKREFGNANIRSRHYTRQSTFADSNRQLRGRLLATLRDTEAADAGVLSAATGFEYDRVTFALDQLCAEGFLVQEGAFYRVS